MAQDPDLHVDRDGSRLVAQIAGAFSRDRIKGIIDTISRIARAQLTTSLVIDVQALTGHFSLIDRYMLGVYYASHGPGIPTAVVALAGQLDPNRFLQLVARNRGAKVKAFITRVEADRWLRERTNDGRI